MAKIVRKRVSIIPDAKALIPETTTEHPRHWRQAASKRRSTDEKKHKKKKEKKENKAKKEKMEKQS